MKLFIISRRGSVVAESLVACVAAELNPSICDCVIVIRKNKIFGEIVKSVDDIFVFPSRT